MPVVRELERTFTAVIVCDVGPSQGIGHLMRCIALAEQLTHVGADVVFVADVEEVPFAAAQLEARRYAHVAAPHGTEEHLALLRRLGGDLVVIDSYHLPLELYAAVVEEFFTVALVDGDPAGRAAHLLVDQNIGAEGDAWPLHPGTVRLAGLEYALMRREIMRHRPRSPERTDSSPPTVFAFFGGTDPFGAAPVLTAALVDTGLPFALTVVASTPWSDRIVARPGQHVEVTAPTDRLAEHVRAADLVLSGAGSSSWELLCLGAACGMTCLTDNQEQGYARLVPTGAIVGLGHLEQLRTRPEEATRALAEVLGDATARARLRRQGWRMVDGLGSERVVDRILTDSRFGSAGT